jgi:lipopolysaccharide biosynthesis protein
MKPILIHVHIYYARIWNELKSYLQNISSAQNELYVTVVNNDKSLIEDVFKFNPKAKIEVVENRGFDIAPFVHILNKVNLDNYSYIVKLHTKRDMTIGSLVYGYDLSGDKWRKYALLPFSKDNFKRSLAALQKCENLGMISNYRLIKRKEIYNEYAVEKSAQYLKQLNLEIGDFVYVIGAIFMVRASCFKPIQKLNFNISDFEKSDRTLEHSKAYTCERLFGLILSSQGYKIADVNTMKAIQIFQNSFIADILRKVGRFIYFKYVNRNGKLKITICRLPVYSKSVENNI